MLLTNVTKNYAKTLKAKGYSETTTTSYLNAINSFASMCYRELGKEATIDQLNESCLKKWHIQISGAISINSVNTYIVAMRAFIRFLNDEYGTLIDQDCIKPPKRRENRVDYVGLEEVKLLLEAADSKRDKALVALLYTSGLRNGEVCSLNREDIKGDTIHLVGKGGKFRTVFIEENTRHLIFKYLYYRDDNNPALFVNEKVPTRLQPAKLRTIFRELSESSGVIATPHTLRHGFATNLVKNGMNVNHLQYLMGHSKVETTQRYTHVQPIDVKKTYKQNFDFNLE